MASSPPSPAGTSSSGTSSSDTSYSTEDEQDRVARLRLAMARLARQQRRSFPTGLTPSQISALITIDHHGPIRLSDLAHHEAVAPPTITRIVAKLEAEALVERRSDESDRRIARVTITDEGHRRIAETREARNEWFGRKLAALEPGDLTAIRDAIEPLERLAAAAPVER